MQTVHARGVLRVVRFSIRLVTSSPRLYGAQYESAIYFVLEPPHFIFFVHMFCFNFGWKESRSKWNSDGNEFDAVWKPYPLSFLPKSFVLIFRKMAQLWRLKGNRGHCVNEVIQKCKIYELLQPLIMSIFFVKRAIERWMNSQESRTDLAPWGLQQCSRQSGKPGVEEDDEGWSTF